MRLWNVEGPLPSGGALDHVDEHDKAEAAADDESRDREEQVSARAVLLEVACGTCEKPALQKADTA